MCISEQELLYLCSAIIQSLAALLGITLVAYGYTSEKERRLKLEIYSLAQTWWQRANIPTADVSRHTTIENAPTFLKTNLKQIKEKHLNLAEEIELKFDELDTFKQIRPALFSKSLSWSFLGLFVPTFSLIFASELNNSVWSNFLALAIIFIFIISVAKFIELIIRILGLEKTNILFRQLSINIFRHAGKK